MYQVIMAGGSGTRFWPRSRRKLPKQFLGIGGGQPLLTQTVERCAGEDGDLSRILVVAGANHKALIEEVVPDLPPGNRLYEPVGRNTAAAIGFACVWIAQRDPGAVAAVLPADHHIEPAAAFRSTLQAAAEAAQSGGVVTIGVPPTRPDTAYGYIARGEALGSYSGHAAYRVERFVEKPDAERARAYLTAGCYDWNAGMFIFKVEVMLEAIRKHMPELADGLDELAQALRADDAGAIERIYPALPAQSIDFGVMEHLDEVTVVPAAFSWSDVGSWDALSDVAPKDPSGNVVVGEALLVDAADCVVDTDGKRLVALVGCRDLVVVDTEDALLVVPKERCQEVRSVLEALKSGGQDELL